MVPFIIGLRRKRGKLQSVQRAPCVPRWARFAMCSMASGSMRMRIFPRPFSVSLSARSIVILYVFLIEREEFKEPAPAHDSA